LNALPFFRQKPESHASLQLKNKRTGADENCACHLFMGIDQPRNHKLMELPHNLALK
jgi:hypothetical protein